MNIFHFKVKRRYHFQTGWWKSKSKNRLQNFVIMHTKACYFNHHCSDACHKYVTWICVTFNVTMTIFFSSKNHKNRFITENRCLRIFQWKLFMRVHENRFENMRKTKLFVVGSGVTFISVLVEAERTHVR